MLALSSAAIGASGAVISQVVAGVITGKREQRKASAESERWSVEAEARRRDRQLDRKIELFGQFLSTSESMTSSTYSALWERESEESQLDAYRQLRSMTEKIGILAPELYDLAKSTSESAGTLMIAGLRTPNISLSPEDSQAEEKINLEQREWVRTATKRLEAWTDIFRAATHAYVSHQPIQTHEEAAAAHAAKVQQGEKRL